MGGAGTEDGGLGWGLLGQRTVLLRGGTRTEDGSRRGGGDAGTEDGSRGVAGTEDGGLGGWGRHWDGGWRSLEGVL